MSDKISAATRGELSSSYIFRHQWNFYNFFIFQFGQRTEVSNWTWLKSNPCLSTLDRVWILIEFGWNRCVMFTIWSASSHWYGWPRETTQIHPTPSCDHRSGTTRCRSCRRTVYIVRTHTCHLSTMELTFRNISNLTKSHVGSSLPYERSRWYWLARRTLPRGPGGTCELGCPAHHITDTGTSHTRKSN
jgi:hypothetical protein